MHDIDRPRGVRGGGDRDGVEMRCGWWWRSGPPVVRSPSSGSTRVHRRATGADRQRVLARLEADGSLHANRRHPAAGAPADRARDEPRISGPRHFIDHLRRSGFRFGVMVHATQGEKARDRWLGHRRLASEPIDVAVVVRGGSRLDLVPFDSKRWPGR